MGATAATGSPSSKRNNDNRSPQLWTSSKPKEGTSPDFSASTFVFSTNEIKSSASFPIFISNTFSPKGVSPTAVCVSLWTSTPTKRVRERFTVCILFDKISLYFRCPTKQRACRSRNPSMRESCPRKGDQSAMCSLLVRRDSAVQSPRGLSPMDIGATGSGCAMPRYLSTLYMKTKSPVEISLILGWGEVRRVLAKNRGQPRRLACQSKAPQKNTLFIRRKRNPGRKMKRAKSIFLWCGER